MRVDRDSTRNKGTWQAMRQQIQEDAVDILVGTQMLAKGHDFPNLTLVGVLNPDGALYSSDFRASEKLFAQLVQVAGRAGRADKPGEVLIQTAFPDHPLFRALREHDYDTWAKTLLAERQSAGAFATIRTCAPSILGEGTSHSPTECDGCKQDHYRDIDLYIVASGN